MTHVHAYSRYLAAAALCAVGCLLAGCSKDHAVEKTDMKSTFVVSDTMMKRLTIDTATTEPMAGVLLLTGRITADENKLIEVYPFVGGTVTKVNVGLGDRVHKGQVLAVIKSGEVAEYERQLIDARSDVAMAQKNLAVQKDMLQSKLASERDLVATQRELEKAEANLRRIQEVYRIYSINSNSEYFVRAPIDGFVLHKDINTDMTLRTDRNTSIFSVAELDDVWAIADVYESDISRITQGVKAEVTTVAYPDSVIHGSVDKVFNVLDPLTKTMSVRVKIANAGFLYKPGMAATVRIRYQRPGAMVAVPASAVVFDGGKTYVMVFHDKMNVVTREVTVAETVEGRSYISNGLADGETIVTCQQLFLYDALND